MPFLRFSRDKRGYANTYLCHTFRQGGVVRMRVLYWFRTPPDIEVGRPALDAGAIRDIEASNPDLTFDWDEILKAQPPPVPQERPGERRERRPRRRGRAAAAGDGTPAEAAGAGEPPSPRASSGGAVDTPPGGAGPGAGDPAAEPDEPDAPSGARRRRRRRRGRGPRGGGDRSAPTEAGGDVPARAGPDPDRT